MPETTRLPSFTRSGLVFDVIDSGPLDGPVVLLLHGFPQTGACWTATAEILNRHGYRTIAPDQRGYSPGARPHGRFAYRASELVDDVAALIDQLGVGSVHLVGHDWGSFVAWSVAARRPELVRTLTAVSVAHPLAFLRSMLRSDQALRSYYMLLFQLPWLPEWSARRFPQRFDRALAGSGMKRDQIAVVREQIVDTGALTYALNWYRAMGFNTPGGLRRRVAAPTTQVWSDHDIALGKLGPELSADYVTGPFRLEVVEGATHWLPEQNPERLADIVLATAALNPA